MTARAPVRFVPTRPASYAADPPRGTLSGVPPDPTIPEPPPDSGSPSESAVGDPVVDPSVLGALAARLGERATGFLAALLDTWQQESRQRLAELDAAVADGKAAGVGRVAHSMRGSSAAMGAVRLSEACGQVELAVRTGETPDLAALRDRLAAEVELALAALGRLHHSGRAVG